MSAARNKFERPIAQGERAVIAALRRFGVFKGYRAAAAGEPFDPNWGVQWSSGDKLQDDQIAYEEGRMLVAYGRALGRTPPAWNHPKAITSALMEFTLAAVASARPIGRPTSNKRPQGAPQPLHIDRRSRPASAPSPSP